MRAARLASALLLVCLTLAACQDDPVGPVDPTKPTPTAATTPTPTGPTPPPLPAAAKPNTPDAAVQFIVHYIDLLNYAANTGDVKPLRDSAVNCDGCETYATGYEDIYSAGGYLRSPGWKPISPIGRQEGDHVTVVTEVNAGAVTSVPRAGAAPQVGKDSKYSLRFQAKWMDGEWKAILFQGEEV